MIDGRGSERPRKEKKNVRDRTSYNQTTVYGGIAHFCRQIAPSTQLHRPGTVTKYQSAQNVDHVKVFNC